MHGHGVNLRHIGLLRMLFLEEATRDGPCPDDSSGSKEQSGTGISAVRDELNSTVPEFDRAFTDTTDNGQNRFNVDTSNSVAVATAAALDRGDTHLSVEADTDVTSSCIGQSEADRAVQPVYPSTSLFTSSAPLSISNPDICPTHTQTHTPTAAMNGLSVPVPQGSRQLTPALDALQSELFLEALCRTLKHILRDTQRSWMKSMRSSSGRFLTFYS